MMKHIDIIRKKINKIPRGILFTPASIAKDNINYKTLIKLLSKMVLNGQIVRSSKGKYYKPTNSIFGQLRPAFHQHIKDLLYDDRKVIGYISGYNALNELGLTTQVPNSITIYTNKYRKTLTRAKIRIYFCRQNNKITKGNIKLLVILDSLDMINKIPDGRPHVVYLTFKQIIKNLSSADLEKLIRLSINYLPRTRAILGALLDEIDMPQLTPKLRKTLKPRTFYKCRLISKRLINASSWNIR